MHNYCIPRSSISGVTIEIEVPSITEQEDAGVVEVCAVVSNGTLARQTIVTVSSRDGSAIGECAYGGGV